MERDDELMTELDWDLLSDAVGALSLVVILVGSLVLPSFL